MTNPGLDGDVTVVIIATSASLMLLFIMLLVDTSCEVSLVKHLYTKLVWVARLSRRDSFSETTQKTRACRMVSSR